MKYENRKVREIEGMLSSGHKVAEIEKNVLGDLKKNTLKALLESKEGIQALQCLKQVISVFPPEGVKKGNSATHIHLWENEDWTKVLQPAGPMVRVAKGGWCLLDKVEDPANIVKTTTGFVDRQTGYLLAKIGGKNLITGEIDMVEDAIVRPEKELFHQWHDKKRVERTSKRGNTKDNSELISFLAETLKVEQAKAPEIRDNEKIKRLMANINYLKSGTINKVS